MISNKKLCIILGSHWSADIGGAQYQVKCLIKELIKTNHFNIFYLTKRVNSSYKPIGYNIIQFGKENRLRTYSTFFDVSDLLKSLDIIKPDIIYQRESSAYTGIAAYFAKRYGCRMLWHIAHDYDVSPFTFKLEKKAPFKFIDKKVAEYGIRTAHYIIAQTKQQKDLLQRYYGRLPTAIIPNFHPFPNEPIKKKEPIKIVYIANFKPSKRPELFVKLAEELAGYGNIQFMMIGRPGSRNKYRLLFERIARINNLKYKNELSIEEVNQVLAQSHVYVNTSVAEGFPNTFIQAWMRKVPVVSLDVDVDGILSTNEVGFHSKTYDNMRSHTIELIRNTRLRTRMGEKAQALAFRKYSMTNASQVVSLLSDGHL